MLIDEEDGIIAGHGRVLAAHLLGLDEVPCIVLAHLTPTQRSAYVLADNKLALNTGWDLEMLSLEIVVPQPGFGASPLLSIYDLIERARPPHIHPCGKIAKGDDPQRADGRDESEEECRWRQVALQDRENGYIGRAACC